MTNVEKRIVFIKLLGSLFCFARLNGIDFIITAFYRSPEEQKKLYDKGLTACDGTLKKSNHQRWLAIDIAIIKDGAPNFNRIEAYETLGNYWKSIGGTWGGDWSSLNDIFHFEYNPGE